MAKLHKQALLKILHRLGFDFGLNRLEIAHQPERLLVMMKDIHQLITLLAISLDRANAIDRRVEAWMLGTLSTPPH
jgi:hypothetical protein